VAVEPLLRFAGRRGRSHDGGVAQPNLIRFTDAGLGNDSYLLVTAETGLVVDPVRDVARYVDAAEAAGATVTAVAESHLHADFVSGARELGERGAEVFASAEAGLGFPTTPVRDGDEVRAGELTLRVLATPGHTPEHVAYLADADPPALFSGGALLPGGAARTDLLGDDRTEELARALYRTLHQGLAALPDDTVVYPTHGAGSICSTGGPGGDRSTTLGWERAANPLLQARSEDEFVTRLVAGYGLYPPYFLHLRAVNTAGVLGPGPVPPPRLSLPQVSKELAGGAWAIDVRATEAFGQRHLERSVSLPLTDSFPVWLGWTVPWGSRLVVVAAGERQAAEAVRRAAGIGYDDVAGWTPFDEAASVLPSAETEMLSADALGQRLDDPAPPTLIDVRRPDEVTGGTLPGAVPIEAGRFGTAVPRGLTGPVVTYCRSGHRSMIVASLLERAGVGPVAVYMDGADGWRRSGRPLEQR
jgi:glyoxylase-like metal-dependent hydrolase (beta-lactamase superfamily II)/rhodanese-related sulfurtransferase